MKLFNQAYPGEVWQAIMSVIADADRQKPIRDVQRTVPFKGHQYEVSLNTDRDTVIIRWTVEHDERVRLTRQVEGWVEAVPRLQARIREAVPKGHPNYQYMQDQVAEAKRTLRHLEYEMEKADKFLSKTGPVIVEHRKIETLKGCYLTCETAFPDFTDEDLQVHADVSLSQHSNGQTEGNPTADNAEPVVTRRTRGRPKGAKSKRGRGVAKAVGTGG